MCGIAGIFNFTNDNVSQEQLSEMTEKMVSRGPDDDGFHLSGSIGLGFRRLSIIDVRGGHQPLTNENEDIHLIFNGEIYNFIELRKQLIDRGHIFRTKSDAEVLLHLYEEKGVKALDDLNGMFAFALFDEKRNELFLARDRLGIKPFFYSQSIDKFVFASDARAVHSQIDKTLNVDSVLKYLALAYVPGSETMWNGVSKLLPGHYMVVDGTGSAQCVKYWSPKASPDWAGSISGAKEHLEYLLNDAVRLQMRSDVPVGIFLSGGVDSSALVAYASQFTSERLKTFTVNFAGKGSADASYARMVAKEYNTEHFEIEMNEEIFDKAMNDLLPLIDEPISDSAIFPAYVLSKAAAFHGVKVLLNGAGADEIFGGYSRHWPARICSPSWVADELYPPLSKILGKFWGNFQPNRGWRASSRSNAWVGGVSSVDMPLCKKLMRDPKMFNNLLRNVDDEHGVVNSMRDKLNYSYPRMMHDLFTYLPNDVLSITDKATMSASVECRVPFLDHRLVEFAFSLPPDFNLLGNEAKGMFRDVLRKVLPQAILHRKKEGFNAPIMKWMTNSAGLKIKEELLDKKIPLVEELFSSKKLSKILDKQKGIGPGSETLFAIYLMNRWCRANSVS
jgi:asparagine synthase (glutamine-hydrolysing)